MPPSGNDLIKVLLAEDVHMVRAALVALLDLEPDMNVVANVGNGNDVMPAARLYRPDVAVLDIDMPGRDGLSVAEAIHAGLPECRTLILTSLGRPATLRRALSARVGGVLLKDSPPDRLAGAIREVAAGRRVLGADLAVSIWDEPACPLTEREVDILRLAASGEGARGIALQLHLSSGTVSNYLTGIVTKLNARNRVDAVRIAADSGWF